VAALAQSCWPAAEFFVGQAFEMSTLKIYGDEAGTMPLDDGGDVFTAACLSFRDEAPPLDRFRGTLDWLVEYVRACGAVPMVCFVRPRSGYGDAVKAKVSKTDTMARATRLLTGANASYLPVRGIGDRNWVWTECMFQAIGCSIFAGLARWKIEAVNIVLDEKSFPSDYRTTIRTRLPLLRGLLEQQVKAFGSANPAAGQLMLRRFAFSDTDITLQWSDESGARSSSDGLRLADLLASSCRQALMKPEARIAVPELMAAVGEDYLIDVTDVLMRPVSAANIETWRRNTGLPEPRA